MRPSRSNRMKRELVVPWSIAPTYSAMSPVITTYRGLRTPALGADYGSVQALALQAVPATPPANPHRSAGQRLLDAFEALERFPVLAGARDSLRKPGADAVATVESDLALTSAVLREANRGAVRTQIGTVPDALERIGDLGLHAIVAAAPTFGFLEPGPWGGVPQAYRMHAHAVQRAADRIARALQWRRTDELRVVVMLHDIGNLVLAHSSRASWERRGPAGRPGEPRIEREPRERGVDHAVGGGVLARRWGLPDEIARA